MKIQFMLPVIATSIASLALVAPPSTVTPLERSALQSQADDSLLSMRAGAPALSLQLSSDERATLQSVQAQDPALLELRGGYLTHDEWVLIGVVALAVIVLAIIL